jgi:protein-tyrosine-phosphatase
MREELPSILFICYGNIMRSAFAEYCFRAEVEARPVLGGIRFASAGVRAYPEEEAEQNARRMAVRFGLNLEGHRATRMSLELVRRYDRLYIMDELNEALLLGDFPEARAKTAYLSSLIPGAKKEIEDPYCRKDAELEACFRTIQAAVRRLAESL